MIGVTPQIKKEARSSLPKKTQKQLKAMLKKLYKHPTSIEDKQQLHTLSGYAEENPIVGQDVILVESLYSKYYG